MTLRKVALVVALIPTSLFLGITSEAISLEHLPNGTPGRYIASWLWPPEAGGWELFGKRTNTAILIDASIWFVLILAIVFMLVRHRQNQKTVAVRTEVQQKAGDGNDEQ